MRVFVVGATGVLGRALVPLLLARGHAVRALARSPERARPLAEAGADVVPGDLLEPELATRLPARRSARPWRRWRGWCAPPIPSASAGASCAAASSSAPVPTRMI